jgi:hypothetical protein
MRALALWAKRRWQLWLLGLWLGLGLGLGLGQRLAAAAAEWAAAMLLLLLLLLGWPSMAWLLTCSRSRGQRGERRQRCLLQAALQLQRPFPVLQLQALMQQLQRMRP